MIRRIQLLINASIMIACRNGVTGESVFSSLTTGPNVIADFTVTESSPLKMKTVDDPVMGGTSYSTCENLKDGGLMWKGEVQIVSFLRSPGFCILETAESFSSSQAETLEYGSNLCFSIDTSDSTLLLPLSVQIVTGVKNYRNKEHSYSAILRAVGAKGSDSAQEFCARLTSDAFKATFRGRPDPSAPKLEKDVLSRTSQIRLSTYSSHKAGPFKVKLNKIYVAAFDETETFWKKVLKVLKIN